MTYQQAPQYAVAQPKNGFGITALVLAIIGVVFGLIPLTAIVALVCGALAILFGALGYARKRRGVATNGKMSITGGVLGVVAVGLGIFGFVILGQAAEDLENSLDGVSPGDKGTSATGGAPDSALKDVSVTDCSIKSEYGMASARAKVVTTNNTDEPQSYWIKVAVNSPNGDRLGMINVVANNLSPGQKHTASGMKASTPLTGETPDSITCKLVEVNRVPA